MKKFTDEHLSTFDDNADAYVWELDSTWNDSSPSDFYFEVLEASETEFDSENLANVCYLFVTPANYFDEEGYCWDQHLPIEHLFNPYDFDCTMEGIWEIEGVSKSQIELDFLNKGFRKNPGFSDVCRNSGD